MKINWGTKIAILYIGFVILILTLVIASSRQHFDLVSANYYADEVAYQKVIDAGRNDANLSAPIDIHADSSRVTIELPVDLKDKVVTGDVQFYSPVNAAWDKKFSVAIVNNRMSIDRSKLRNTRYTIKIDLKSGAKNYYQETEINLHS